MEIDLGKEEIFFSVNKIKMGFSVEDTINKLKQKELVTITEINTFKEGAQQFIISMLAKLFEISALGSTVLRSASMFDPTLICDLNKEKLQERQKQLLKRLIVLVIVALNQCDKARVELKVFKEYEVKEMQPEFSGFSLKECRIDDYFFKIVGVAKYKELSYILKLLLTMSHGQAAAEPGFRNNNALLKTNISPEAVVSKTMNKITCFHSI